MRERERLLWWAAALKHIAAKMLFDYKIAGFGEREYIKNNLETQGFFFPNIFHL